MSQIEEIALEQNRQRLLQKFLREIAVYEQRYELLSNDLEGAVTEGRLPETAEITSWLLLIAAVDALDKRHTLDASDPG